MPSKLLAQLAEPGAKPSGEALAALSGLHTKALHDFQSRAPSLPAKRSPRCPACIRRRCMISK